MTGPRTDEYWEEAGRSAAEALDGLASVLVVGDDAEATARAAIGLGRAQARRRRVAVGDLIGDSAPLQALVPADDDPHGIVDSFLYGVSLNRIARRADASGNFFVLPSGTESVIPAEVFTSPRWRRLASGFREVGALLILAAPASASGLDELSASLDGVVLVGRADVLQSATRDRALATIPAPADPIAEAAPEAAPAAVEASELSPSSLEGQPAEIATVDSPAGEVMATEPATATAVLEAPADAPADALADAPRETPRTPPSGQTPADAAPVRRRSGGGRIIREPSTPWLVPALAGTAVVGVAFYLLHARDEPARPPAPAPNAAEVRRPDSGAARAPAGDSGRAGGAVLGPVGVINPDDSSRAAAYAIELWRSMTYESATARVERDWPTLPAVSITPIMAAGKDSVAWYRVAAGAYADSNTAASRRAALRARGGGTLDLPIVRTPYALRLYESVALDSLGRYATTLRSRRIPAYALLRSDGRADVYAGAFESVAQANAYRAAVAAGGLVTTIVFRVGEPYAMPRVP